MKHIEFWFDPISPYAYLAFEHMPVALQGLCYSVSYRPVLFAALLKHHGQLGPAEIAGKREWTFRQVQWLAQAQGTVLDMPSAHPFNPLALLRLCMAHGQGGACNRFVAEQVLHHVWRGGQDPLDAARLQALGERCGDERARWQGHSDGVAAPDPHSDAVKAQLKANTDQAIANGLFGVPSLCVDGKLFWGHDALPMLRAYLQGHAWFDGPAWQAAAALPHGVQRQR